MIYRFKGTATPFIKIKGKRADHYINPEHITSIQVFEDKAQIFISEMNIEDGYGEHRFYDVPIEEFKEIFE